jgi:hypothetical protein
MPRLQVYLPDDLYKQLKRRKLRASELFQKALREELRRADKRAELKRYLDELDAERGPIEPTSEEEAWAEAIVNGKSKPAKKKRSA